MSGSVESYAFKGFCFVFYILIGSLTKRVVEVRDRIIFNTSVDLLIE